MKKNLIITVLFSVILIFDVLICVSCSRTEEVTPQAPAPVTTIIQIHTSNADGQPGTQISFEYEVFFEPLIEFYGEAFPVKILSTATRNTRWDGSPRMIATEDYFGDSYGDFGVTLSLNGSSDQTIPVRVEIEGDRFIRKSSIDVAMPLYRKIEIFPRISYDYNALERLVQPASENVYFRLFYGSAQLIEKMEVVRFHSVNEVPFYEVSRWDDETILDNTWLFAAYVNEDDPIIDTILKEALQIGVVKQLGYNDNITFSGYQIEDEYGDSWLSVDLQVLAVWSVFLNHNIKYSDITTTSTANNKIATQYVRTLGESFGNSQANCVDGSVLFASVLRKIGINTFLVLVPGHMFVGYYGDDDPFSVRFLETTMMGDVDISGHTKDDSIWGKIKNFTGLGQTQSSVILDSFLAAQDAGRERYVDAVAELWYEYEQYYDDLEGFWDWDDELWFYTAWYYFWEVEYDDYAIIDISDWRSTGVMPITRY